MEVIDMEQLKHDIKLIKSGIVDIIQKYELTGMTLMGEAGEYKLHCFILFDDPRQVFSKETFNT